MAALRLSFFFASLMLIGCKSRAFHQTSPASDPPAKLRFATSSEVVLYHWTRNEQALKKPDEFLRALMKNAQQTNKKLVVALSPSKNVVGDGAYFSPTPFSSMSFGDILITVKTKPGVKIGYTDWDAGKSAGQRCEPTEASTEDLHAEALAHIRSDVPAIVYCWKLSEEKTVGKKALVVRDVYEADGKSHSLLHLASAQAFDFRAPKQWEVFTHLGEPASELEYLKLALSHKYFVSRLDPSHVAADGELTRRGAILAFIASLVDDTPSYTANALKIFALPEFQRDGVRCGRGKRDDDYRACLSDMKLFMEAWSGGAPYTNGSYIREESQVKLFIQRFTAATDEQISSNTKIIGTIENYVKTHSREQYDGIRKAARLKIRHYGNVERLKVRTFAGWKIE